MPSRRDTIGTESDETPSPEWKATEDLLAALRKLDRGNEEGTIGATIELLDIIHSLTPAGLTLPQLLRAIFSALPVRQYGEKARQEILGRLDHLDLHAVSASVYHEALRASWASIEMQITRNKLRQATKSFGNDRRFGPVESRLLSLLDQYGRPESNLLAALWPDAARILSHGKKAERRRLWVRLRVRIGKCNDKLRELNECWRVARSTNNKGESVLYLRLLE